MTSPASRSLAVFAVSLLLAGCPSSPVTEPSTAPSAAPDPTAPDPTAPDTGTGTPDALPAGSSEPAPAGTQDASAPPSPPPSPSPSGWTPPVLPTSSPGCGTGPTSIAQGKTYTTPSGRTYHVHVPSGYDRTKAWPVVVMFHGIGTNGADFASWFEQEKYVRSKAIVVYPDAQSGTWDLGGAKDLDFFDALLKQLGGTACIDPSRVLGFGFSWGAYFTSYLGCKRAGYVKAISTGAGGGSGVSGCGRLPVLVTHRTADPDESVNNGRATAAKWTQLNGCTGGPTTSNATLNCTSQKTCLAPGAVTYCEDTWTDASWPSAWNHTVREVYRQYVWDWFAALP